MTSNQGTIDLDLELDLSNLSSDLRRAVDRSSRSIARQFRDIGDRAGDAFTQSFATTALGGVGIATLGAAAASATAGIVSFTAALAPATGAILAIPAAAATATAAVGTLAVAFSGMGEALEAAVSGDAEEFQEALEGLSPAAQQVARDFRDLVPALEEVRSATQEAFFGPLQGQLQDIASSLLGPVREGMIAVAEEASRVALGISEIAQESETAIAIENIFATTRESIQELSPAIEAVVRGFRDLISGTLPAIDQLGSAIGDAGVRFGEWLSSIAESGQALEWIQDAFAVLTQLGDLLGQVGGIISSVFEAANASGETVLETLTEMLRGVNEFLSSGEGQSGLVDIFTALREVGAALRPVISELFSLIAGFAPAAADIATALGPGLTQAIRALGVALSAMGPGLTAVSEGLSQGLIAAAPGIADLGRAFGSLMEELSPLLPALGDIVSVLGSGFAQAIEAILPALEPVVESLVDALAPVLPQLAEAFTAIVEALGPLLPLLGELLGFAIQLVAAGLDVVLQVITAAFEALGAIIQTVVDVATWLWNNVLQPFGSFLAEGLTPVVNILRGGFDAIGAVFQIVGDIANWLWNTILVPFGNFLSTVFRPIIAGIRIVFDAIGTVFQTVGDIASWLWHQVLQPFGNFLSTVFGPVIDAIAAGFDAIVSAIEAVIDAIRAVLDWIGDAIDAVSEFLGLSSQGTFRGGTFQGVGGTNASGIGTNSAPMSVGNATAFPELQPEGTGKTMVNNSRTGGTYNINQQISGIGNDPRTLAAAVDRRMRSAVRRAGV